MVRFIIPEVITMITSIIAFTFQYGQIYYGQVKIERLKDARFTFQYGQIYYTAQVIYMDTVQAYLHSNMVRFIINTNERDGVGDM